MKPSTSSQRARADSFTRGGPRHARVVYLYDSSVALLLYRRSDTKFMTI